MIEYLTEQEVLNMDTNYIIETKNLTKQYGSQKSVADLNIHVKRGRIYGLHYWNKKSDEAIRLAKECGWLEYPCEAWENLWSAGEKRSRKNHNHEDAVGLNKSDFRGGQNLGKVLAGKRKEVIAPYWQSDRVPRLLSQSDPPAFIPIWPAQKICVSLPPCGVYQTIMPSKTLWIW